MPAKVGKTGTEVSITKLNNKISEIIHDISKFKSNVNAKLLQLQQKINNNNNNDNIRQNKLDMEIKELKKILNDKDNEIKNMKQQLLEIKKDNSDIAKLLKLCHVDDAEMIYSKFVSDGFDEIQKMKNINDTVLKQMGINKLHDRIEILNGIQSLLYMENTRYCVDRSSKKRQSRSRSRSRSRTRNNENDNTN